MNAKKIILIFLIFITTLYSASKDKLTLQLDWLHQFQFAGYYIAKEKGYYSENNLDVSIKEFQYTTNLVDNVLKNENQYSVGKSSLIIDKLQGKDIVLLAAIYQNSPMVLISLDKSNIKTIENLKNKKVMLTPDARSAASINSMIKSKNIKLNEIDFIEHSFKLEDLINGKTDAMGCYLSNEPYSLMKKNIKFKVFDPKDYGFDFYGGLLFTSKKELKDNPQRVKSFYDASIRGWNYAFENIEETAKIIYDKYNTQNKTLESLIFEGKVLKELALYEKGFLGHLDEKKINEIKRLYLVLGFVNNKNFQIDDIIFNKNEILFNNEEKNFLKNKHVSLLSSGKNMPFSFMNENFLEGIEIEFWNLINKKLNSDFSITQTQQKKTQDVLVEFNYNINTLDVSKYAISKPISKISMAIATKNDKNFILDLSILKNSKIAILKNSDLYLTLKEKYSNIEFIQVQNIKKAFELLEDDQVFGVIDNILTLSHQIIKNNYNDIKVTNSLPYELKLRLVSLKENKILIEILNKIIDQVSKKEKETISQKYQLILYQQVSDYSWIYKFVLPLIVLLVIITVTNTRMRHEIKKRKIAEKALIEYANKDSLTKVFNRRKIEVLLSNQIRAIKKTNDVFSIIFFDIDDFKSVNDEFGHVKGDRVLIIMSTLVSNNIRKSDFLGRWGGEEFIIILPGTTSQEAFKIADNLRELISQSNFNIKKQITSSFGITQYKKNDTKKELIKRADEAMYFVKNNGKNAVKIN